MCDRISEHYRRVAGYRYDPTERLAKARRYAEAARRIRDGATHRRSGLPGLSDAAVTAIRSGDRRFQFPEFRTGFRLRSSGAGSFDDLFDLPVLQVDRRAAAQEADHGDELIALCRGGSPCRPCRSRGRS